MRFIDLFSGIGGFRLGMESVGHECIGFCEIDKFARESYKSIFQTEGEIEFHDIRDVSDDEFKKLRGKVDVICGGFPCQAFSIAGRRLGFEDTRGTLFFEIARAAKQIQPRFLFLENVKGLLNHDKGRTFTTILTTLDELGFDVEWQMLNSKDFGVPQNRERVFIIGHSRKRGTRLLFPFRREGQATNPETLKILGNLNPSKSGMSGKVYYSEGLAPTLVRGKGEGFKIAIPCMTPDRLDKRQNGRRFKDNQEPMFTLNTQDRHGIVVVGDLPTSFKETGRVYGSEGLSPTLTTMQGGDKIPKILIPEPIQFLKVREATKKGYAQAEIGDSINLERPSSQHRRGRVGKGIANTLTTSGEFHDIRDVSDDEFKKLRGKVDVICGGFPCQAFSIAGRRLGFEDTRGTLFFEIARAAKQIQPRFLFLENVKGLLNHDKGRTFTTILTTLDELGFDVEWQVLNSKDFGVPKNRERVFIIGHSRKKGTRLLFPFRREGQATNSETLKALGNLNPSRSGMSGKVYYSEGLAPTLVRGKGEGFKVAIPCMTPDRLDKRQNGRRFKENQEPMFTLNTQDRYGIVVVGDLPTSFKETGRVYGSEGLSPTLTTMQGGDKIPKILIPEPIQFLKVREATKKGYAQAEIGDSINLERPSSQHRRGRVGKGIANTLTTSGQMGVVVASYEGEDKQVYQVAGVLIDGQFYRLRIRRITPKECFRLQGFPDWAFEAARKVSSNSQLYKQAGNSVTVPVIAAIAKKLKEVEEKDESIK
ncbi:putative DNA methylase [Streptococcus pneumoniae]|nr:putative DNA methylase [Streptococcus pneumoniae]